MTAEVTSGIAGKTLDITVPWTVADARDVADHLGEYARGCSEFTVHFDVTSAQRMHDVRIDSIGVNEVALRLTDDALFEALGRLIRELGVLKTTSALLLLDCFVPNSPSGKRRVLDVDEDLRRILISADVYDE